MRDSGVEVYMNCDTDIYMSLKNLSWGLCRHPGGLAIKDFNQ
eukprot:gene7790-1395_t